MCRRFVIEMTPSEKNDATRWIGVFVPVYASIALILLGALVLPQAWRSSEPVAVANRAAGPAR